MHYNFQHNTIGEGEKYIHLNGNARRREKHQRYRSRFSSGSENFRVEENRTTIFINKSASINNLRSQQRMTTLIDCARLKVFYRSGDKCPRDEEMHERPERGQTRERKILTASSSSLSSLRKHDCGHFHCSLRAACPIVFSIRYPN
ncbi:hypothetical protein PUN28_019369 [Cardiocondyla obscurior]|uniref:Uncharacterized protein n=1 Tax=Cardiocondyla obscurior TaxID=286306 RepID=A0AAW2EFA1_9HYME